ncbi:MAG TPA: penicillin-binding transpeptidase domain-containing protein [Candidatus Obscuribacterales bacterium]
MGSTGSNPSNFTGRRQFLKSLLGVSGVVEASRAEARAESQPAGYFYWADLKAGQVGFPAGTSVEPGSAGSVLKLVSAAAMRDKNVFPANQTFECTGTIALNKKTYSCQVAHGRLTLTQAIAHSCNVFFAQAAERVSAETVLDYARRFGLEAPVAGYPSGPFPERASAEAQSYVLGLCQDLRPQGLQILRMVALIATRGSVPYLHSAESPDPDGQPFRIELSAATWSVLGQGMHLACREGTARDLDPSDRLRIAAKTGTAPYGKTFQSWVAGYFPYDAPRYAFCARALHGTSQEKAVPLARKYLFSTEWP